MTTILIEGWRGVNHSFAMVNQCQILELLQLDGVRLFHRDMPFAMAHWNQKTHDAGFRDADSLSIAALREPLAGEAVDCIYRICSPFRAGPSAAVPGPGTKTLHFMVTEMGLSSKSFWPGDERSDAFTRGANCIVTPSTWSRERLLDWGYAPDKVHVVPHGVNSATFYPLSDDERSLNRLNLGLQPDQYVFLNLGAAIWNKGLDILLLAYAMLRQKHRHTRLVIKDQRSVYGIGMDEMLAQLCQTYPALFTPETLGSIMVVGTNLTQAQLRVLYGLADCYVSPYRAEGFNLPVLESLACGVPVAVTGKGATDDFCAPALALRIDSQAGVREDAAMNLVAHYQEPSLDATVDAMERMALGRGLVRGSASFQAARQALLAQMTWRRPAVDLLALAQGPSANPPSRPNSTATQLKEPSMLTETKPGQAQVLDLLKMIRPWTMRSNQKLRVGNAYDGGYVLPAAILNCDAVVSIGVGHDVSFDYALAQRGAKVLQYDHTVQGPPQAHENFRFHKLGWGTSTQGLFISFNDIHAELKGLSAKHPMLKFDIEGAEYDVLEATSVEDLSEYEIIACEVHDFEKLADPAFFSKVRRAFEKLTVNHVPIHLHANNYQSLVLVEGVPIPKVLEVAFLRRDLDTFPGFSSDPIPGPLDRPNHPLLPDICMNPF